MAYDKSKYSEKLKDPRWQKKRLEILSEAEFSCYCCGDAEKTLHVHHSYYKAGLQPWEYPDNSLYCLCETCHDFEEKINKLLKDELNKLAPHATQKLTILGYLQAVNDGSEYPKEIELIDYEHAQGIGLYWELTAEEVIHLAKDGIVYEKDLDNAVIKKRNQMGGI